MRSFCLALSFLLLFEVGCRSAFAGAFSVSRSLNGSITSFRGEAAAPKIGTVLGSNLIAVINNDTLEIDQVEVGTKQRSQVLSGKLFGDQIRKTDTKPKFTGLCFFNGGRKLPELVGLDSETADFVLTLDGKRSTGKITNVDGGQVTIVDGPEIKQIPVKTIDTIVSSRVFKVSALLFTAPSVNVDDRGGPGFEARILRFELDPTLDEFMTVAGKDRLEKHLDSAAYTKTQKKLIVAASIGVTLAAIAIPVALAVPLAGRHKLPAKSPPDDNMADFPIR